MQALRLAAQHVAKPALASPRAVATHMLALQAQDGAAARWALGLRMRRPSLAAVERSLARGEILRTWPMRGTLHVVAARDARWLVGLLAPRALARAAGRRRELGISGATIDKARAALVRAIGQEGPLARPDAYAALELAGVRTTGQRGIHVIGHLAQEGTLFVGPPEGRQPTYAILPDGGDNPNDAMAHLARRYIASHGPATAADLAWWSGTTLGETRAALGRAGGLREEQGWRVERPRVVRETSPAAHLLPAFDEMAVGYKDRSAALHRVGRNANAQIGLLSPCIIIDGQMVGTWGRTIRGDCVRVTLKPLVPWSGAEREAVAQQAERFATFLGLAAEVETKPLTSSLPGRLATRA